MKKILLALLLVPALCISAHAQNLTTADEVLNAYFKALGDKKILSQLKDITGEATVGTEGFVTMKYKTPLKTSIISGNNQGQVFYRQVCDGQRITIEMGNNKVPFTPALTERGLLTYQIMPELYFGEKGVQSSFAGKETIDGKETYKLVHTMRSGLTWSTNYDTQTSLKVQQAVPNPAGNATEVTRYGDYREVDGIQLPFMIYPSGGTLKLKSYRVNTGLSDAEFVIK